MSPRRHQLLDAALHVVADRGLRGLTHRAVDREAGLPEGSCSAYLRTRQALQVALTEYVASTLAADVDELAEQLVGCAGPDERAVGLAIALFERWLHERELLVAKLELSLEASRNPELAALLGSWRARLVDVVSQIMSRHGREHSVDRAEALVAAYDGILFAAMLKPARARRTFLSRSLALTMRGLTAE
ncbi:hypothetical protein [Nocardioides sp.]|uniref:TetR/AcrR family transcriptional regulator n=1 Tax=Nocardioides sp. TaxID=35761 RepID=UPI0031FE8C75